MKIRVTMASVLCAMMAAGMTPPGRMRVTASGNPMTYPEIMIVIEKNRN
jgi:hypothetical protein